MPGDASVDAASDAVSIDAPPDADVTCSVAPPPRCLDATTLASSRSPGVRIGEACAFETFTSVCQFGCAGGACQPAACTPSCPAQVCVDDGCGGACGPCPIDTTFPGVTPVPLGIARDLRVAPDGIHVATLRAFEPDCGGISAMARLDVWTVPATGAATHRTIAARVPLNGVNFTDDGYLVYSTSPDPCEQGSDLWIARADGRDPVPIASNVSLASTVAGGWVYYTGRDPDDPDLLLYTARIPAGAPRVVTRLPLGSVHVVSPTGDAVWVTRTRPEPNLILFRADGPFRPLVATPLEVVGSPVWSPDGKRLAYAAFDRRISRTALHVVEVAGGEPVLLDDDCECGDSQSIAFSPDAARIAWLARSSTLGGRDMLIHRFAGGADVRMTDVVAPNSGDRVFRLAFSVDGSRLHAAVGNFSTGSRLLTGRVDVPGTAVALGGLRSDAAWDETGDGAVIAFSGNDSTTRVVTHGAGTQSMAGIPFEGPRFERAATSPRLLVQQDIALSVFPTSGAGPGIPMPGFDWTDQLSIWARGQVPFVFGWSGPTVLYPSAVNGSSLFVVVQDLMAWTPSATGRLAARVIRYRVADSQARIFLITQDQGLFVVPRPAAGQ